MKAPACVRVLALLALVGLQLPACAHENLPALLLLQERAPQLFDVSWRVPAAQGGAAPSIRPVLPADCEVQGAAREPDAPAARVREWQVRCAQSLGAGSQINFEGLPATMVDALVRLERADGGAESLVARPGQPVVELQGRSATKLDVPGYFALGLEHIGLGWDHLLFVLGLVLLVPRLAALFKTVTAFTLAHSLTLALAALGVLQVPSAPVEACIALSIVFVARELLRPDPASLVRRAPWVVAFGFGLLHGLGFAGALAGVGLPEHAIALALLLFNLGVEAGQLLFVALVLAALAAARRAPSLAARVSPALPAYAIGAVAACWCLQRTGAVIAL